MPTLFFFGFESHLEKKRVPNPKTHAQSLGLCLFLQ
jgi:hypothetical protein